MIDTSRMSELIKRLLKITPNRSGYSQLGRDAAEEIRRLEQIALQDDGYRCEWCKRVFVDGEHYPTVEGDPSSELFYCRPCIETGIIKHPEKGSK